MGIDAAAAVVTFERYGASRNEGGRALDRQAHGRDVTVLCGHEGVQGALKTKESKRLVFSSLTKSKK